MNIKSIILIAFIAGLTSFTEKDTIKYDGSSFEVSERTLLDYGVTKVGGKEFRMYEFVFTDGNLKWDDEVFEKCTYAIFLGFRSPSGKILKKGTYKFKHTGGGEIMLMDEVYMAFDKNNNGNVWDGSDNLTSNIKESKEGQMTVSGESPNYIIEFEFMMNDGKKANGIINGPFKFIEDI
ncbi:MAG: hypothetical protein OEW67_12660 [Cyclobacteriaceae bacterium]|nr:hypothetical protein [Cyclobacteriaceae bacterium]